MKIIYENVIKDKGECAEEFLENNMFVLFGDSAPDEIKDFCYWVDVAPINGTITVGQTAKIGGQSEVDMLGTIYVENKPMPELKVGMVIQIIEE